jgi:hypothetical protein
MTMPQAICMNLVFPIPTFKLSIFPTAPPTAAEIQPGNHHTICHTFRNILDASEREDSLVCFSDCIVNFTVNITESMEKMMYMTLNNSCWKRL